MILDASNGTIIEVMHNGLANDDTDDMFGVLLSYEDNSHYVPILFRPSAFVSDEEQLLPEDASIPFPCSMEMDDTPLSQQSETF